MVPPIDDATPDPGPILTHKPGAGGLFDTSALCGADSSTSPTGVLRMHDWEYDCTVCAAMAGERR